MRRLWYRDSYGRWHEDHPPRQARHASEATVIMLMVLARLAVASMIWFAPASLEAVMSANRY